MKAGGVWGFWRIWIGEDSARASLRIFILVVRCCVRTQNNLQNILYMGVEIASHTIYT